MNNQIVNHSLKRMMSGFCSTALIACFVLGGSQQRSLHRIVPESFLIAGWHMMRSLYRRRFLHTFYLGSRQSIDQFHEAGVVKITNGGLATWLHPFGMLEPQ